MRPIRALLVFMIGAVVSLALTYVLVIRPRVRAWGVDPTETDLPIPGDDLVPEATTIETRGVTIDGPVAKVWPYLVQMGFGRAGWYSYDAMDMKGQSAETIRPEFQHLAAGDIMPVGPAGGFAVKTVDFERALVLYTDTEMVREQARDGELEGKGDRTDSFPEFSASWAFFLKPTDDGKARLIERFRIKTPGTAPATAVLGEVMGTGIVLMTRKQMLRIKELVERPAESTAPVEPDLPIPTDTAPEPSLAG